jgi:hypothetical protein
MAAQSSTSIANRALQMVGASTIMTLADNSPEARAANNCYDACRRAELRAHRWNFARQRALLAASATPPAFGYSYAFPLPVDCLYVPLTRDWASDWDLEGRTILTNAGNSPGSANPPAGTVLALAYIADVEDTTLFDPLFCEALAARMAVEMVERLTQSNQKAADMQNKYKFAIAQAASANAFEQLAQDPPEDDWIAARGFG